MRSFVTDLRRATVRCSVLALVLALGAGPSTAFADSANGKRATAAGRGKQAAQPASRHSTGQSAHRKATKPGTARPTGATAPDRVSPIVVHASSPKVLSPGSAVPSLLLTHPAKAHFASTVGVLEIVAQSTDLAVPTRTVAAASSSTRAALPAEGPTLILGRPAAYQADVPVFVAVIGLLLVLLGARNVGRFRKPTSDALDLSWD